jgi:RNA polymerase sigma-70 factor (ECF subfamily)
MSERRELPNDPELIELRSRFLTSLGSLRPTLHRFCALMCGSVLDGEDLVQETLAAASFMVSQGNPGLLDPSLFEMAYQRCKYFIYRDLGHRERPMDYPERLTLTMPRSHRSWLRTPIVGTLVSRVSVLRPLERAVVVMRDVLGFSSRETVRMLGIPFGHFRSSLWLARVTLRSLTTGAPAARVEPQQLSLLQHFADSLNRLDGPSIHRLARADARLEIVGAFNGRLRDLDAIYAGTYAAMPWEWRQSVATVDGDPALITSRRVDDHWTPYSAVRLWWEDGMVVRIRDYMRIKYILREARIVPRLEPPAESPS